MHRIKLSSVSLDLSDMSMRELVELRAALNEEVSARSTLRSSITDLKWYFVDISKRGGRDAAVGEYLRYYDSGEKEAEAVVDSFLADTETK